MAADDPGDDGADAKHVGDRGARRGDGLGESVLGCGELGVEAADLDEQVERDALPLVLDRSDGPHAVQRLGGSVSRKPQREATFDEFADQRVEPVDALGAGSGQLVVTVGEQAQHLGVICGADLAELGVTHGDDRGGAGVVRVALVVVARVE